MLRHRRYAWRHVALHILAAGERPNIFFSGCRQYGLVKLKGEVIIRSSSFISMSQKQSPGGAAMLRRRAARIN